MKVENKSDVLVQFSTLPAGTAFRDKSTAGTVSMKIGYHTEYGCNAVSLGTGTPLWYEPTDLVAPCSEAKVVGA